MVLRIFHNHCLAPFALRQEVILVTDAATSTRMGGAVLITTDGRVRSTTINNMHYHSVNDLEAQTVYQAMSLFRPQYARIVLYTDNTATLSALAATHSKSFHLNLWVGRILALTAKLHSHINAHYVTSKTNIADGLSRRQQLSDHDFLWIATVPVGGGWRWCSGLIHSDQSTILRHLKNCHSHEQPSHTANKTLSPSPS
jgi:hypothetical protein